MSIAEHVKYGIPLKDIKIIDCHCHIGFWHNFNVPDGDAEGMLKSMDALGVDMAFVTAHSAIGPDYVYGNNLVIDAVQKYPDRFMGYVTVNPNYGTVEMEKEIERCFLIPGMKGIKLHPSMHGRPVDYKTYNTAFCKAQERKCPVLIHVWGEYDVAAVGRLAGLYPEALFIMGHAGGEISAMELAAEVVANHENVYVDIAYSRCFEGNVEWLVSMMSSKKVLFGTDLPFMDPRPCFGRLAMADLSDEEKQDIFGLNLLRLLEKGA